jgi:hypothetical protein
MSAANKITKYDLGEKALELSASCTTMEIARLLTEHLQHKGVTDSISQPTVARFIKAHRDERASRTKALVESYVQGTTPKDLERCDQIIERHFQVFKNLEPDPEIPGAVREAGYSWEQQSSAAMKVVRVIETKLKWSGILNEKDPEDAASAAVKKLQDDLNDELMGKIDAVGTA